METLHEKRRRWMKNHPTVQRWLDTGRVAESTANNYLEIFHRYFQWLQEEGGEFAGCSPEELVERQADARGRDRYKQLDTLQRWISGLNLRAGTKRSYYAMVKSFYMHNRAALPDDPGFTVRSDKPPVRGRMDVEDFKRLVLSCNKAYQAIYLIMFQGGMGVSEFLHFNENGWEQIREQLYEKGPVRIDLPGRKHGGSYKNNPFYTFIGHDAKEALKKYLKEERGEMDGGPIILNKMGNAFQARALEGYFTRHADRVGIIKRVTPTCPQCEGETVREYKGGDVYYLCKECGSETPRSSSHFEEFRLKARGVRYGINLHELRDLFRSEWEVSPAKGVVAEFMMGHDIDENNYNKFYRNVEFTRKEYMKAEHYLNIISEDPRTVSQFEVTELRHELDQLKEDKRKLKQRLNGMMETPARKTIQQLKNRMKEQGKLLQTLAEEVRELKKEKD